MNDFQLTIRLQPQEGLFCRREDVSFGFSRQYERDSFVYGRDDSFMLFIGVCYNRTELAPSNEQDWPEAIFSRFQKNGKDLLRQIEGFYAGLYYDPEKRDLLLFTDHLSTIPVFYRRAEHMLMVDTDLLRLAASVRELGGQLRLSEFGAQSMLAYSFMLGEYTLLDEVYRVPPASIYSCRGAHAEKYFEYYPEEKDDSASAEQIIEGFERIFSQAVRNEFLTDGQYPHLVTLSGGLDSRMCLFYALKNGFHGITTLNYSQTFYREETIAKKIAADCRCQHIFFSLDNGNYLANIDEGILATQGLTTYRPILSARMVWRQLQMERFGLVHSGLLGDAVWGGFCIDRCCGEDRFRSPADMAVQLNAKNGAVLSAPYRDEFMPLFERILDWIPSERFSELPSEKFVLDNRYINGLTQSALGTRGISVLSSPFAGKELMRYVFSFPSALRKNHSLYFAWMKRYMPEAAAYRWENTNLKPFYGNFAFRPKNRAVKLYRWLDANLRPGSPERSRNPYRYWMKNNGQIQLDLNAYCSKRLELLREHRELFETARRILAHDDIYLLIRLATLLGFFDRCRQGERNADDDSRAG